MKNPEFHKPVEQVPLNQPPVSKKGREYWRSLNELAEQKDFESLVKQEFPRQAALLGTLGRRDFLKLMGASLALAGLAACVPQPATKILPYTKPPEELVPGQPVYFASTMVQDGYAKGVLIETTMGRPIKVDGNPKHPVSLGSSDIFMQASLLELYDPDRAKSVTNQGVPKTWQDFVTAINQVMTGLGQGGGLRILTGPVTSPTLNDLLSSLLAKYPQAKWVQYSPLGRANTLAGTALAFGQPYEPLYDFTKADIILSLDSDFLFADPGHLRYSHDFSQRHQPVSSNGTMSRLYVVESSQTLTGSNADHRLPVKPSQVEAFARLVANRLGISVSVPPAGQTPGESWLDALVADLKKAGKSALVLAGERQPAVVHALAYAINQSLGSIGNTVNLIQPVEFKLSSPDTGLQGLVQDLNGGQVDVLVVLDGNPAYSALADLNFADAMKKAGQRIYLGNYLDETAALATWFVPATHYLEMWGDARAFDGTLSLIQPVIEPLYAGKSPYELVAALMSQGDANGYDLLSQYWQAHLKSSHFDQDWRQALSDGLLSGSASLPVTTLPQVKSAAFSASPAAPGTGLEIVFAPDDTIWDGRFTNNAWLQELPKPLTKLTWDNAAYLNPATAGRLGFVDNDVVEIKLGGRSVQAPVFIQPGEPDDVVVVTLGYGRQAGGSVLEGTGYNAYTIRTAADPWFASSPDMAKTGKTYPLYATHDHWTMENRDLVRSATLGEYQANPKFAQDATQQPSSLYGQFQPAEYAWGLSINLNTCIGCNACVLACQAENNIPTVGKEEVGRSREMHWIRIDRYFKGPLTDPAVVYQPVPCMQCEKATCEPVCPVEATSHSAEGLNEMTYNRCVGTRYCSNNCPYKVRRFNFFKYNDENVLPLWGMRNPDVTVRSRGVMEKCTYCVQRINQARIQAEVAGRKIADGEIRTACQQACPTNTIVFGDINDPNSAVRKLKDLPLNYSLLAELGTRPRTTYLAQVKNPNPSISDPAQV
jgi:molybdopterin-containing oxidoreductase family iron-sulfur binding subunit